MSNKQRQLTSLLLALYLLLSLLPIPAFAGMQYQPAAHLSEKPADQADPAHTVHMHHQHLADAFLPDTQLDAHLNTHQQSNDCPQWLQASCIACCACPVLTTEINLILRSHLPTLASVSGDVSERTKERLERPPRALLQIT